MNAAEVLQVARAAGVRIGIDGGDLVLEASAPPPLAVLDLLSCYKASIVALLSSADDSWSAEDWRVFFEERAGIAEFDGGVARGQAEACAFACCIAEWLKRNPRRSPPERCRACGGVHEHEPLPPSGIGSTDHVWLHAHCRPAWYTGREVEAVTALVAIGISLPTELPDDIGKTRSQDGRLRVGAA